MCLELVILMLQECIFEDNPDMSTAYEPYVVTYGVLSHDLRLHSITVLEVFP